MAIALVGVIGGILVCMIGILISMVVGIKHDVENRDKRTADILCSIQTRLSHMVLAEDYKGDKKEIDLKLDDHGDRILTLEIHVKEK